MSVYAVSDLHGCFHLYEKIKKYINSKDIVYFLGDAGDRGPESWKTITTIINDSQFIYLKGNHEDLLSKAIREYSVEGDFGNNCKLLYANGGQNTLSDWQFYDGNKNWADLLQNLPIHKEYIRPDGNKILLSHAGYTPQTNHTIPKEQDLLWDRNHIYDSWDLNSELLSTYIVHGHTPIHSLMRRLQDISPYEKKAYFYSKGHKIDIDSGAFMNNYCILFNLDTFESVILNG